MLEDFQSFIKSRVYSDIYPEPPSELHSSITTRMIELCEKKWINESFQDKTILDLGCGQGFSMELFLVKGGKPTGVTLGEDFLVCKKKGLNVLEVDLHELKFAPNSFRFIWCRHVLEHSLFPLFTLFQLHQFLTPTGFIYIEVPAPDTCAKHEFNPNHYSCFSKRGWLSLFSKVGFEVRQADDINFNLSIGPDKYFYFLLQKL